MENTIFITGGTGFLGEVVTQKLARHYNVKCLTHTTSLSNASQDRGAEAITTFHDFQQQLMLVKDAHVLHVATDYGRSGDEAATFFCNLVMPLQLSAICAKQGHHFVNVDSFFTKDQFSEYDHLSLYIKTKRQAKQGLYSLASSGALKLSNCMVFHMFGPTDSTDKFVPRLMNDLKLNKTIEMTSATNERDFIHVNDVADGLVACIDQRFAHQNAIMECELGCGHNMSIKEFAESAKKETASRSKIRFGALPERANEVTCEPADLKKNEWCAWEPKLSLQSSLATFVSGITSPA